jgi:hypothetical protein
MDKNYILEEIQYFIDAFTNMHNELANSDLKFDANKIANDIGCATNEGRGGLSILINSIPNMEYRLNKYRESGDIEDLTHFMEMANKYYDAIAIIRTCFNKLDDIRISLKGVS